MIHEISHPLVKHYLSILRNKKSKLHEFREAVKAITVLLAYQATKDLQTKIINLDTPVAKNVKGLKIKKDIFLVPILRAGLGMLDGFEDILPDAKIATIGLKRNEETLRAHKYYENIPSEIHKGEVFVIDPMLATGGSIKDTIDILKKKYTVKKIRVVCIVAAPEGITYVKKHHPDVEIYTAVVDKKLNKNGYIVPGLGDAGDRIFGTV